MKLGTISETGKALRLDLDTLVATRLLVTATSGGGKSWALRRLAEGTQGDIQQIIIDPEGEFGSLREVGDYVLAGKGGDVAARALRAGACRVESRCLVQQMRDGRR